MVFWLTSLLVVIADQVSKYLVVSRFYFGESIEVFGSWLHFTFVRNTGAAFGILSGRLWFFVVFTLIVLVGIIYYCIATKPPAVVQLLLGLIAGGAMGNFIDRLFKPGVVDFIDLGWWPVFNLADSAITCGAVLFILYNYFIDKKKADDGKN